MIIRQFFLLITVLACFATRTVAQDSIPIIDSPAVNANSLKADVHVRNAQALILKNQPAKAFTQLIAAQNLYRKDSNGTGEALVQQLFGDYYFSNYVWGKAEAAYQESLKLAAADDYELKGNVSARLGDTFLQQQKSESAAKYYSNAINQFDKADLNAKSANNYVSLARVRSLQKRYSDAEFLIMRRALPLFRSAGFVRGRIGCFDVLGELYLNQKRYSEAKWYYIQANMLARTLRDTVAITESLINLGRVKTKIADYKLAAKDLREAEYFAKKHKYLKQQRDVSNAFSQLYAKTGDKYASYSSLQKYGQLKDSMHAIEEAKVSDANSVRPIQVQAKQPKAVDNPDNKGIISNRFLPFAAAIPLLIIGIILFFLRQKSVSAASK